VDRADLVRRRFERLLQRGLITRRDAERFRELDEAMSDEHRVGRAAMGAFHDGREYQVLLLKIVEGLVTLGEPHAKEKRTVFKEESATMGPGVFLTPWEMTLAYLDDHVGTLDDVVRWYG
jgi:hypothetical protein